MISAGRIVRRNLVHILAASIVLPSIFISKTLVIAILLWLCFAYVIHLIFKHHPKLTTLKISKYIDHFSYDSLKKRVDLGPLFFGIGLALPLIFFPDPISYAAIMVLCFGDGFSAMSVLLRKRIHLYKDTTVEGTLMGVVAAFVGASLFVAPIIALFGAIVGMLAEVSSHTVDDNLVIPVFSGFFMWLVMSL